MSGFSQLSSKLVPTGEHGSELPLDAQAHIWNHILNFINSMSLKCAIELGIPDIIHNHGKPMTLSELTAALPIHPTKASSIYRLMRILNHSDFFALRKISENIEQEDLEGYVLTNASRLLLKDNPFRILSALDPNVTKPWHYLTTWFQNDDPTPFETAHGMRFWDYAKQEREVSRFFNDAMANDARLVMSMVIDKCKGTTVFEGLESVVDVGGSTGTAAKAIADAFPDMKFTVLDLPHVVVDLQGSKNLIYHGGDMFEAIPPADGVLLKVINFNDMLRFYFLNLTMSRVYHLMQVERLKIYYCLIFKYAKQ
jgi:trans-resveratrol di-O-methyltransferase